MFINGRVVREYFLKASIFHHAQPVLFREVIRTNAAGNRA
jgi:hypothetical protein